jgi:hypothetical protein
VALPQPEPGRIDQAAALLHAEADDLQRAYNRSFACMVQAGYITQLCRMQARVQLLKHLADQVLTLSPSLIPNHD